MLLVWIVQAARIALSQRHYFTWKAILNFVASGCLVIGATGFFGSALSATGGLKWLPESFEWPIGIASGVLTTPDGSVIVPHIPSGRIQIYNKDLSFRKGWFVDAGGGTFKILPSDGKDFYVITARGNHKYLYSINGCLLSHEIYQAGGYSRIPRTGGSVLIPTPFCLMVFVHPFASWVVAAIGMLLLFLTGEIHRGENRK